MHPGHSDVSFLLERSGDYSNQSIALTRSVASSFLLNVAKSTKQIFLKKRKRAAEPLEKNMVDVFWKLWHEGCRYIVSAL